MRVFSDVQVAGSGTARPSRSSVVISSLVFLVFGLTGPTAQGQQDVYRNEIQAFDLDYAQAETVAEILNQQFPLGDIQFSANKETNKVYGRVPGSLVAQVKDFVSRLDRDAEERARKISQAISNRAAAASTTAKDPPTEVKIFSLRQLGAREAWDVIKNLGFEQKDLSLAAELRTNSLVARGTPQTLRYVEALVAQLDRPDAQPALTAPDRDVMIRQLQQIRREYEESMRKLGSQHPQVLEKRGMLAELFKSIRGEELPLTFGADALARIKQEYEIVGRDAARIAAEWRELKQSNDSEPGDLEELRSRLQHQVEWAFQLQQKLKEYEVAQAARQLELVRRRLQNRQKIADQIVQRRVNELIKNTPASLPSATGQGQPTDPSVPPRASADSDGGQTRQVATPEGTPLILRGKKPDVDAIAQALEQQTPKALARPAGRKIEGAVRSVDPFAQEQVVLNVGRDDGLQTGDTVGVWRKGRLIARLKVGRISADEASATILSKTEEIIDGDQVRLLDETTSEAESPNEDPDAADSDDSSFDDPFAP